MAKAVPATTGRSASSAPSRAVILAAGRGRRLRPHTDHTPKPLLPVGGRPTLDYVLAALAHAGVDQVCLVTRYLAEQIEAYVGDGARWGMAISFRRQPALGGAAQALQAAVDFLAAPAFVVAADYALSLDSLRQLKAAYLAQEAALAVSLKRLPTGELSARSSVRFSDDGRILEIVEKPAPGAAPGPIGASLIFIVPPDIRRYLKELRPSARGEYELQTVINQMLRDGYPIAGCLQAAPPEPVPDQGRRQG